MLPARGESRRNITQLAQNTHGVGLPSCSLAPAKVDHESGARLIHSIFRECLIKPANYLTMRA